MVGIAAEPGRIVLAQEALRRAEQDLGVRRSATVTRPRARASRDSLAVAPRKGTAESSQQAGSRAAQTLSTVALTVEERWPVRGQLASLLPDGSLPHGTVVAVRGSAGLLLALLAGPSQAGAWAAVVGYPTLGLLAAHDAGIDLDQVALVPAPGPDAATTVAALLDGLDIVVVGPAAALTDSDRRRLAIRARERSTVLISTEEWPGAHLTLTGRAGVWEGIDQGAGWLRRRTLMVERGGRAAASVRMAAEVEIPLGLDPLASLGADPVVEMRLDRATEHEGTPKPAPELRLVG